MNLIHGFVDELVKLAQMGPRPAPGTRMPKPVYPEKTWTPKPKQRKETGIPKAEGIVPGTFQRQLPALPSGKKMPKAKGIVSEVGARKKWEAKVKKEENKLPGWLSDSMKRPVKGHPMAKPEAVARSKKEDAEAKKLVAGYTKKKPGTALARRGRRGKAPQKGVDERKWLAGRMKQKGTSPMARWLHGKLKGTPFAPSEAAIKQYRTTGKVGPQKSRGLDVGGKALGAAGKLRGAVGKLTDWASSKLPAPKPKTRSQYVKLPGGGYRQSLVRKPMTVPGYKAVAKKKTI